MLYDPAAAAALKRFVEQSSALFSQSTDQVSLSSAMPSSSSGATFCTGAAATGAGRGRALAGRRTDIVSAIYGRVEFVGPSTALHLQRRLMEEPEWKKRLTRE
jgi:hypothetical protein